MPLPEYTDPNVAVLILRAKRPPKPRRFETLGMSPAVWKIAEKCWHQKARKRPDVNTVLQLLENLANSGVGSRGIFLSDVGNIDLWLW